MAIATYQSIAGGNADYPSSGGLSYSGGEKTFAVYGTWDGATMKMKASFDGGTTFITLSDTEGSDLAFLDNAIFRIKLGQCLLRFVISGSGGSTDLAVKVS